MWSAIGRSTARQVRVSGRLSICTATRLTAQLTTRTTPAIPSGIRVAAVFVRGFAVAKGTEKKPAAKKATAEKTGATTAEKKTTAKTKAPAAKKTKAKAKAKAKPKPKPKLRIPKKELTPEEKTKLKIRELKKDSLAKDEPTYLPITKWMVFSSERLKGTTHKCTIVIPEIAAEYRALPAAELEKLDAQAQLNKVANEATRSKWIASRPAHEIHRANLARQHLRRFNVRTKHLVPDDRYPKKPITPWVSYVKAHFHAPAVEGDSASVKFTKLSVQWKQLSAEERKPYEEVSAKDVARFKQEKDEYHRQQPGQN